MPGLEETPPNPNPPYICKVELLMKTDGSMDMGVDSLVPTLYLAKEMCEQAARRIEKLIIEREAKLVQAVPALPAALRRQGG